LFKLTFFSPNITTQNDFFTGLSCLIDDNIFLLDDIIKEKPLVLMIFNPQISPQIIEDTLSLQQAT